MLPISLNNINAAISARMMKWKPQCQTLTVTNDNETYVFVVVHAGWLDCKKKTTMQCICHSPCRLVYLQERLDDQRKLVLDYVKVTGHGCEGQVHTQRNHLLILIKWQITKSIMSERSNTFFFVRKTCICTWEQMAVCDFTSNVL